MGVDPLHLLKGSGKVDRLLEVVFSRNGVMRDRRDRGQQQSEGQHWPPKFAAHAFNLLEFRFPYSKNIVMVNCKL
jgi:hypothetical protein